MKESLLRAVEDYAYKVAQHLPGYTYMRAKNLFKGEYGTYFDAVYKDLVIIDDLDKEFNENLVEYQSINRVYNYLDTGTQNQSTMISEMIKEGTARAEEVGMARVDAIMFAYLFVEDKYGKDLLNKFFTEAGKFMNLKKVFDNSGGKNISIYTTLVNQGRSLRPIIAQMKHINRKELIEVKRLEKRVEKARQRRSLRNGKEK